MIPGQHIWYIDIWISDFTIVIYHIWIIKSWQVLSCIKFATCGTPIVLMPAAGFGCCSQMWIANMRISPTFGNIWYCLVVLTILKNMSSSMGRIIPNIMEHVWNHQPGYVFTICWDMVRPCFCKQIPMSKAYLQQTVSSVDPMADDKPQRGIFSKNGKNRLNQ